MNLRVVELARIAPVDVARWVDLRRRAINPYPGMDPRFVLPAVATRSDAEGMRLLFAEDGERLLLAMPFVVERRVSRFPVRVLSTRDPFLFNESAWHFPLVDSESPEDAFTALFAGLHDAGLPGLVEFSQFPGDGPLWNALGAATDDRGAPRLLRESIPFAWAARAGGSAAVEEPSFVLAHSPEQTHRRAKQLRQLEKHLGTRIEVVNRADDPEALEQFMDLQAAGWKGDTARGGKGLRLMHFDNWFREVAANFRADGDLFLWTMLGGDEVVYMRVCLRVDGGFYSYADTYDERFAAFGPGSLGRIACTNLMLAEPGAQFFDPNMDARYVESSRLYPDRRPHSKILVAPGGVVSRSVVRALPLARDVRNRMRGARTVHA